MRPGEKIHSCVAVTIFSALGYDLASFESQGRALEDPWLFALCPSHHSHSVF